MKILEILTILVAILFITQFIKAKALNKLSHRAVGLSLFICIIFMSLENGFLWQYYFMYIFLIIVLLIYYFKTKKKILISVILLILSLLFLVSSIVFPHPKMPKCGGEFLIGTKTYDIVDETRLEKYDNCGKNRKIRTQVWYPIDSSEGIELANWLIDGNQIARGVCKDASLPTFLLDKLSKVKSNSYLGGKLSDKLDKYPVVIISHGWAGLRSFHQDFAEELASRGFIVFAIDHSYGSVITIFEDGDKAEINYDALSYGKANFMLKGHELVNTYARDVARVIDFSEELNESDAMFRGRMDVDKIGLLGHSTGGGGDVRISLEDDRIKAVIGMDAWVEPISEEKIEKGLDIPSLFFRSEQWEVGTNNGTLKTLFEKSLHKPLIYQIDGTTHYDFAMVYMLSPYARALGISGDIGSDRLNNILEESICTFFDKVFSGENPEDLKEDEFVRKVNDYLIK